MKKCYRIFYVVLSLIILFNSLLLLVPNEPIKADGPAAPEEFKTQLQSLLGHSPSEQDIHDYSLLITTLTADGWNTIGLAGVLGNIVHESSAIYGIEGYNGKSCDSGEKPASFQPGKSYTFSCSPAWTAEKKDGVKTGRYMGGEGHGIVQWSFTRATNLSSFCDSNSFPYVTVTHYHTGWTYNPESDKTQGTYKIPNMPGQVAFICYECSSSYKGTKTAACACTNARDAAKSFHDTYEKSMAWNSNRADSAEVAVKVIEACTGVYGNGGGDGGGGNTNPGNPSDEEQIAEALYGNGWGEEELSAFCVMSENTELYTRLTGNSLEKLSQEDVSQIAYWEQGDKDINDKGGLTYVLRTIIMAFGIALVIWAVLFYTAYWVDTLNNIFDFSFVNLLSFGRLVVSPDPDDSTYGKNKEKGAKSTINHFDVIRICLVALGFGVLILTGVLYKLIFWLIITVTNLLKRIF